ncbi:MAG: A1 family peptidase [Gammaproteobacteria bacterium]|nr:A1 family peptidase [Gammaproteobacteria bacterium]MBU2184980.1 A1 family peptidase [Gammaproteobacteria bacterium]MBU2205658.1 A1 family peptidase [Gammaproteobacteria bacterium]
MPTLLRLPITNVYANGDYTVTVCVGSEALPLQLVLDTGSSTLALHTTAYQTEQDSDLVTTSLVQEVIYGIGGWAGAVVQTSMQLHGDTSLNLAENYIAVAAVGALASTKADGILGLAYKRLNQATDISQYLQQQLPPAQSSLPWPFASGNDTQLSQIQQLLADYPKRNLCPWFSNIAQAGVVNNCFAFYCRRSSVHYAKDMATPQPDDPLNQGWFILGGGTGQTDLYQGEFDNISVLHDVYYNVQLTALQVDELPLLPCAPGNNDDLANGFFDTGASAILLPNPLYQQLLQQLAQYNPALSPVLQQLPVFNGVEQGIDAKLVELAQWPPLHFYFAGDNGNTVKLTCPPGDYWQHNAPAFGLCSFKLIPQFPHFASQHIIGLPLLCNYYSIFDRAAHHTGIIRCAKARR